MVVLVVGNKHISNFMTMRLQWINDTLFIQKDHQKRRRLQLSAAELIDPIV